MWLIQQPYIIITDATKVKDVFQKMDVHILHITMNSYRIDQKILSLELPRYISWSITQLDTSLAQDNQEIKVHDREQSKPKSSGSWKFFPTQKQSSKHRREFTFST